MKAYLQMGLPKDVVTDVFRELAPLRMHLSPPGEDARYIELEPPTEVEFEAGLGIRVVTKGTLKFELAALKVPAHLDRVEFRLMPRVVNSPDGAQRIAFPVEILEGDLRFIPGIADDFLVSCANHALGPGDSQLLWNFNETLSARFKITERLQPVKAIGLSVSRSEVLVTAEELIMRVYYEIDVEKGPPDNTAFPLEYISQPSEVPPPLTREG